VGGISIEFLLRAWSRSTDADMTTSGNDTEAIQKQQQKAEQFETKLLALQASVPPVA
jgi:hypothetical protein